MTDHPSSPAQLQQTPMPEDGITDEHLAISGLNKDWNRLREALSWYTDAANCRRGVFGQLVRNGNRNRWEPDNGNMARAALSQGGSSDQTAAERCAIDATYPFLLQGTSVQVEQQKACTEQSAKSYVERAIASYAGDPADNQFQKGFLAALEVVRDEAFLPTLPASAFIKGAVMRNMSPKPNGCNPCDWPECGCQGNVQQRNLYSGDFAAEFMETIWEGCADRDCLPKCRTNDGHCERLKLEYDEWLRRAPSLASADGGGK